MEVIFGIHYCCCVYDSIFRHSFLKYGCTLLDNHETWWIVKVKHPSLEIFEKYISLMRIKNKILVLSTHKILSSSFVIYIYIFVYIIQKILLLYPALEIFEMSHKFAKPGHISNDIYYSYF